MRIDKQISNFQEELFCLAYVFVVDVTTIGDQSVLAYHREI